MHFKKKIGVQFISTPLVIVYHLDNWPKGSLRNFTLKNVLFGATNTVKDNDKEKYLHSSYGKAFDGNS